MANRLVEKYKNEVAPALKEQFKYTSTMEIPKLEKIVLNVGVSDAKDDAKAMDNVVEDLTVISGQKPIVTRAKKSVANFKLRAGMEVGCKVTLRGERMYEFFDKLVNIALPRTRDFRGINPNSFDGRGNFAMGTKEQLIFPEIDYDSIDKIRGMDIVIVTTAKTDEEAKALLTGLGMPYRK
ncbi:MAG: 50S ribosomal protein L5 [Saccharofermentanales bacterium]|jgi:large subunit ribosomal protein L5